jgi:hypothetical protein
MTFVMDDHHFYAWCRDCPYTGPLRFSRDLAEKDAAAHLADRHRDDVIVRVSVDGEGNAFYPEEDG